jgi:hypothetical protein
LFSPDPEYKSKVRRLHRDARDAARLGLIVACFWMSLLSALGWKSRPPGWSCRGATGGAINQQWRAIRAQ